MVFSQAVLKVQAAEPAALLSGLAVPTLPPEWAVRSSERYTAVLGASAAEAVVEHANCQEPQAILQMGIHAFPASASAYIRTQKGKITFLGGGKGRREDSARRQIPG